MTDKDTNCPGELPGPEADGIGQDGLPVKQLPYSATRMRYFDDASRLMTRPFAKVLPADVARSSSVLDKLDSLVLADVAVPKDAKGRPVEPAGYFRNLKAWVQRGGNLVLTDKAVHGLVDLGLVEDGAVEDLEVYQPYSDIGDFADRWWPACAPTPASSSRRRSSATASAAPPAPRTRPSPWGGSPSAGAASRSWVARCRRRPRTMTTGSACGTTA